MNGPNSSLMPTHCRPCSGSRFGAPPRLADKFYFEKSYGSITHCVFCCFGLWVATISFAHDTNCGVLQAPHGIQNVFLHAFCGFALLYHQTLLWHSLCIPNFFFKYVRRIFDIVCSRALWKQLTMLCLYHHFVGCEGLGGPISQPRWAGACGHAQLPTCPNIGCLVAWLLGCLTISVNMANVMSTIFIYYSIRVG